VKLNVLFEDKSKLIYLDLDETLIYTSHKKSKDAIIGLAGYTLPRPHLNYFLKSLKNKGYIINLLTYGTRDYAKEVLASLKIKNFFNKVIAREDIVEILGKNEKLEPGTLVDNEMPEHKVKIVAGEKIKVGSWNGDNNDSELLLTLGKV